MRRRFLLVATVLAGFWFGGPLVETAHACPMCRAANETNDALPRAYMFSILFMLAVPATLLTGYGVGFYRLSKRQQDELGTTNEFSDDPPAGL